MRVFESRWQGAERLYRDDTLELESGGFFIRYLVPESMTIGPVTVLDLDAKETAKINLVRAVNGLFEALTIDDTGDYRAFIVLARLLDDAKIKKVRRGGQPRRGWRLIPLSRLSRRHA